MNTLDCLKYSSIFLILSLTIACIPKLKLISDKNKYTSDYFNKDEFVVYDKRVVNSSHSLYVAKNINSKNNYVFYLDNSRLDSILNYFILDKILITLDSQQYIQTGTFENTNRETYSIVTVEKYNGKEIPDPSIKIYDLWILDTKREKFVKKNEKKYYRIHEGFYLKNKINPWLPYEPHKDLVSTLTILTSDSIFQSKNTVKSTGNNLNFKKIISNFYESKYIWRLYQNRVFKKLKKIEGALDEIKDNGLTKPEDLNHKLWIKTRNEAKKILKIIS